MEAGLILMLVPVPSGVPPQLVEYHFHCAPVPSEPPTTVNVVLLPWQIDKMPLTPVGATDRLLTVMSSTLEVAGSQPAPEQAYKHR